MSHPKVHMVPTKEEQKVTLPKLLQTLSDIDMQLIEMPQEELDVIKIQLPQKVDGVFHYLDSLETRIDQLRAKKKELDAAIKSLESKRSSVEQFLAKNMVDHGFEKLPGNEYEMIVRTTEAVEIDDIEISDDFLSRYSTYVRTKHEISKEKLRADLKEGIFDLPFARVKKNHHLRFSPKKKG